MLSHVRLFVTTQTVAHQAPLSTGFSRQEYWSGLLFPLPGDLSNAVSCVSCIGRQILYHKATLEALNLHGAHLSVNLVSNLSTISLRALGITD